MRPDYCLIILHVAILASLFFTLEADGRDSECEDEIKVRRSTVYEASLGKELRINCTIQFCNSSPPSVSWYKAEKTFVLLDVISNSRIRTEWKSLNYLEGTSYLIFQNTLQRDSGVYRCRTSLAVSHNINVTVHGRDSECEDGIKVRRNTVYEASHGEELRINCTIQFCNSSPPSVSWYKAEKTFVLLDVISNSRIRTEWKSLNYLEGTSYLIFQNTLQRDSGMYRCRSGPAVSHNINVTVRGRDSECEDGIKVRRNTVYEASHGKELRINCTIQFCNSSPPSVSWYKAEKTFVLLDVISNSRIRTEWKSLNYLEGTSYLIFQNTLQRDSGVYRCRTSLAVSHNINVTVHESPVIQDRFWPYVYRAVGIIVFVMIVITICVASKSGCKGARCAGPSKDTPDPSNEPSHHALSTIHIYDNDQ